MVQIWRALSQRFWSEGVLGFSHRGELQLLYKTNILVFAMVYQYAVHVRHNISMQVIEEGL